MKLVLLLLALFLSFTQGQVATPTVVAPTASGTINEGPENGGEPFPLILQVELIGGPNNCSISFSHPTRLVSTTIFDDSCTDPQDSEFTELTCTMVTASNVSNDVVLINGQALIAEVCASEVYSISLHCGSSDDASPDFTIIAGTSDIAVAISHDAVMGDTENLTNVPIVDFQTNPDYTVTVEVTNVGCTEALEINCTINFPSPLKTIQDPGVVELREADLEGLQQCRRLASTYICPSELILPNGYTLAINDTRTFVIALSLTGNGTLNSQVSCTALRSGGAAVASITAYGIGVIENVTSTEIITLESDDTDDLVINTIIPLSVFGGVMLFLVIVGAVTIAVYIFVKKVILSEENVGF